MTDEPIKHMLIQVLRNDLTHMQIALRPLRGLTAEEMMNYHLRIEQTTCLLNSIDPEHPDV